jgi:hypothetical protein
MHICQLISISGSCARNVTENMIMAITLNVGELESMGILEKAKCEGGFEKSVRKILR